MVNPLISIIIPIFKVEDFLPRCINSVLNQSYNNLEIILVDDGSPDNCPHICDEYSKKDNRIKVIHQKNQGLSVARNSGLNCCAGEYVYFLDSDDFISHRCIEVLYEGIVSCNAEISVGRFVKFYDNDVMEEDLSVTSEYETMNGSFVLSEFLSNKMPCDFVIACNKLIRKNILLDIRFPQGKFHEDEYFNWKIYLKAEKVCYVSNETYYYYQRASSITGVGFGLHNLDYLGALEERLEYFEKNNTELFPLVLKQYRFALLDYFYMGMKKVRIKSAGSYEINDFRRKFIESYKDFPYNIDKKLYTTKDRIKCFGFIFFPSIVSSLLLLKYSR